MLERDRITSTMRELARTGLRYRSTVDVLDYWLSELARADDDALPDFDPIDVPRLLSFVYVLEREGNRMRYRVSGESVNQLFGSNHGGKCLDEVVPPAIYTKIAPFFLGVFERVACIFKGHVILPDRGFMEFERLLVPVDRGGAVQLLGSLALSTTAVLQERADLPPRAPQGFNFTQVDLTTVRTIETAIPLDQLPVDDMPYESHHRLLA